MIRKIFSWAMLALAMPAQPAAAQNTAGTSAFVQAQANASNIAQVKSAITGSSVAADTVDRSFTTIAGSQLLVSPNPERVSLTSCNNGSATVALAVAPRVVTSVADAGAIPVTASSCYTFPVAPKGDVYVYSAAPTAITVSDGSASLPDGQYSRRTIGASSRMGMPTTATTGILSRTDRTTWYARSDSDITDHTTIYLGWYYTTAGTSPVCIPNAVTVAQSIEYPAGVLTRTTFGGNSSGVLQPCGMLVSDATKVRVAAGDRMGIRASATVAANTNAIPYQQIQNDGNTIQSGFDNGLGSASAASDYTLTYSALLPSTYAGNSGTSFFAPSAVISTALSTTSPRAIIAYCDSICYGQGESTQSAKGAQGWVGRLADNIGLPYVKIGRPGIGVGSLLQANTVLSGGNQLTNFVSILPASHLFMQIGTNDILGGTTPAQEAIDYGKVWSLTPGKRPIVATFQPRTTSTDLWATSTNQTPLSNMANSIIMANLERIWGSIPVVEAAKPVSSASDSNLWAGASPRLVADGTHDSSAGALLVANDNTVQAQLKKAVGQ